MSRLVVRLLLHNSLDLVLTFHNGPAKRRAQLERLVSPLPLCGLMFDKCMRVRVRSINERDRIE